MSQSGRGRKTWPDPQISRGPRYRPRLQRVSGIVWGSRRSDNRQQDRNDHGDRIEADKGRCTGEHQDQQGLFVWHTRPTRGRPTRARPGP